MLQFSILMTVEGVNPDGFTNEVEPRDLNRYAVSAGLATDYREGVDCVDHMEYREVWREVGHKRRTMATLDASGIIPARDAMAFLDDSGVIFEDCETMGTLWGPLGGHVPDFAFMHESPCVILSLRVTPVWTRADGTHHEISPHAWQVVRRILRAGDYFIAARGRLARGFAMLEERDARKAEWEAARQARGYRAGAAAAMGGV